MAKSGLWIPFSDELEPDAPPFCLPLDVKDRTGTDLLTNYLKLELDVSRLNKIHKYLWLAGRPSAARPLHQQYVLGREIVITEQADLHLTWLDKRIFIKPLPRSLLHRANWSNAVCKDRDLHKDACGFLLSYVWLVRYESDLRIAHEIGLLPSSIQWRPWSKMVNELLNNIDTRALTTVNKRYGYGVFRINRLNMIYRISSIYQWRFEHLIRGYFYGYRRYSDFFVRNFAWLLIVFIYVSTVLTAMQVGLATPQLEGNEAFQKASQVFAIFAIVLPAFASILMIILGAVLFFEDFAAKWTDEQAKNSLRQELLQQSQGRDSV